MNRMDTEDEAREPGAGNVQSHEQSPGKQRVCGVQKNIDDVIAGCVPAKKMMLDPEYGVGKREIISRSSSRPDFQQPRNILQQRVAGYQKKIVPHKIPFKRR